MKIIGIIPARHASTRFPGKALVDIGGKSMVQRVYEQALQANLEQVIVATDHNDIKHHVEGFGGNVVLTAESHRNGTERCREVVSNLSEPPDYVVNIQGDEPFIDPRQINLLSSLFDGHVQIATLIKRIEDQTDLFDNNVNKVAVDKGGNALYFSRQTIPFQRDDKSKWLENHTYFKHIGIYGYRADILPEICQLDPSPLEEAEKLEQLRWLEHGYSIKTAETEIESVGIDTPEDLEKLLTQINSKSP